MLSNCHLTQNPALPPCTYPMISLCCNVLCSAAYRKFHFCPVFTFGGVFLTARSLDCDKVISRLVLAHLNSSTKMVIGNSKIPFSYNAAVLRQRGTPSESRNCGYLEQLLSDVGHVIHISSDGMDVVLQSLTPNNQILVK